MRLWDAEGKERDDDKSAGIITVHCFVCLIIHTLLPSLVIDPHRGIANLRSYFGANQLEVEFMRQWLAFCFEMGWNFRPDLGQSLFYYFGLVLLQNMLSSLLKFFVLFYWCSAFFFWVIACSKKNNNELVFVQTIILHAVWGVIFPKFIIQIALLTILTHWLWCEFFCEFPVSFNLRLGLTLTCPFLSWSVWWPSWYSRMCPVLSCASSWIEVAPTDYWMLDTLFKMLKWWAIVRIITKSRRTKE